MYKIIELEIDPSLSADTGVFEVAWVEYPAIEQEFMYFTKMNFFVAPEYVQTKACQAIKENEKRGNPAGTQVGKVRAQQLCSGENLSLETIKRMKSFLSRAATYDTGDWDDNGTIAMGLWGGAEALTWVNKILQQEEELGIQDFAEGMSHYTIDGKLYEGPTHKHNDRLMTGEEHTEDSQYLYHKEELAEVGPRGGIRESKKAPKSDTPNKDPKGVGSAKGDASKRGATVSAEVENTLQKKVDDFNEKDSNTKNGRATLGQLKTVYARGLAAYNTSHSPNVSSPQQWSYARTNAYLYLLKNGRPQNPKYKQDNDLLPSAHPKKDKMSSDFSSGRDVSFEWNNTLDTPRGIRAFENELSRGSRVHIITDSPRMSRELVDFTLKYQIPSFRVHTEGNILQKVDKIKELGIVRHYDTDPRVRFLLGEVGMRFDYVLNLPVYVNYPTSGDTDSMLVEPSLIEDFSCGCGEDFGIQDFSVDIFGYETKHFDMCPTAVMLFEHLKTMTSDEDTMGMIRSAAQIADNVFEIEKNVVNGISKDDDNITQARILVDDFKDLMGEIDEIVGMDHDVSFMDNHISIISDYINGYGDTDEDEVREAIATLSKHQLFERAPQTLQGLTEPQVKNAGFRDGQKLYRYTNFFPGISDSREFCMSIEDNYFRRSMIDALRDYNIAFGGPGGQPYSKWIYQGGPNCVHAFEEYVVRNRRGQSGDLITDLIRIGPVAGNPGTPMRSRPLQGYRSEESRAKSKRAYAIQRSKEGFNTSFMDEHQFSQCFGAVCDVKFSEEKTQVFAADKEQRMIYTPLMIPDILIPRFDEVTKEKYYVKFSPESIRKIRDKFMIQLRGRMTNYEHSDRKFEDVVMVESWIVEGDNDKAYELGFTKEQITQGTWMGAYKVLETPQGDTVWNEYIKPGKIKGASVEGNFILNFSQQSDDDYLLSNIINILKQIDE